ncbi:MAG TPA: hypothetical protein V6D48_20400, partial [Oculatellaceae cyanobacterium]
MINPLERFEIVEEIGKGSALSIAAAALSVTVAVTTLQLNPSKEMQEVCRRVVPTGLAITVLGGIGVWWSDRTLSDMADRVAQRIEEARWQSLRRATKGKGYSIASCRNCQHLVGHLGNDKVLICAMHPYGWMGWDCPDQENKDGL